jgi:CheY-like chemotaxis protein
MVTILHIQDDKDISDNTAELLELEGYKVISIDNGTDGIGLAKSCHPDLIICDIIMRETDGYTVFKTLLQDISIQNIPFIFSTANSEESDREKANKIGFCEYLIKPFDGKELLDCVKRMLVKYKLA